MKIVNALLKVPSLWVAVAVAVLYVILTALYQQVRLPGAIALPLFMAGEFALLFFVLSVLLSTIAVFSQRHSRAAYLPVLINLLTFSFLYWTWFVATPTQTSLINNDAGQFNSHTGAELPRQLNGLSEFDNKSGSFIGDGDAELSFHLDKIDLQEWMTSTGFQWRPGPFKAVGDTLNEFNDNGSLIFKDGKDVEYVVIDRTPDTIKHSSSSVSDSTTIFVNQSEGWVLIRDYDL